MSKEAYISGKRSTCVWKETFKCHFKKRPWVGFNEYTYWLHSLSRGNDTLERERKREREREREREGNDTLDPTTH